MLGQRFEAGGALFQRLGQGLPELGVGTRLGAEPGIELQLAGELRRVADVVGLGHGHQPSAINYRPD